MGTYILIWLSEGSYNVFAKTVITVGLESCIYCDLKTNVYQENYYNGTHIY